MVTQINDTSVTLEWSEPLERGGRQDLSYAVECLRCGGPAGGPCSSCGDSVSYRPAQSGLSARRVVVWGLLPHTTYTFSIQALNGVSQRSGSEPASESVNITTSRDGEGRGRGGHMSGALEDRGAGLWWGTYMEGWLGKYVVILVKGWSKGGSLGGMSRKVN